MDGIVRKVMQKYKENILESDQTNDDNLWDVFKSILKGLHDNAVQQFSNGDGRQNPNPDLFLQVAARGVAVSGYTVGPAVILAALKVAEFTSSGIAARSAAAGAQSSIAAKGVVVSAPVLGLTAGVVGLVAAGIHYVRILFFAFFELFISVLIHLLSMLPIISLPFVVR
ncbi:hypothetical protein BDP27DRAFT_1364770 [Rhodocollybia butyracea]|uniref:Uncharacterized protein n=1 Tax=Rhodocollybia butyracea TaxID=206335 RepID=A0A9P5PTA7_9AGAR|nr:hypothetical protein BDP27DRAFT_1364770 [Rhodocollybia butyracea]